MPPPARQPGCDRPPTCKIAASWSYGPLRERKNYGLACDHHRDALLALAREPPPGARRRRRRAGRAGRGDPARAARPAPGRSTHDRDLARDGPRMINRPEGCAASGRAPIARVDLGLWRSWRRAGPRADRPAAEAPWYERFLPPDEWQSQVLGQPRRAGAPQARPQGAGGPGPRAGGVPLLPLPGLRRGGDDRPAGLVDPQARGRHLPQVPGLVPQRLGPGQGQGQEDPRGRDRGRPRRDPQVPLPRPRGRAAAGPRRAPLHPRPPRLRGPRVSRQGRLLRRRARA